MHLYLAKTHVNNYNFRVPTDVVKNWQLLPESEAKPQPECIPQAIRDDYTEACRIRDLSPKASAALSRRCLQSMVRDFCGIEEKTLNSELNALKEVVDQDVWQAIDELRKVGNIGAHLENVNYIVDVDPGKAQRLIGLLEILFKDWYVAREQRRQRLADLTELGEKKYEERREARQQGKAAKEQAAEAAQSTGSGGSAARRLRAAIQEPPARRIRRVTGQNEERAFAGHRKLGVACAPASRAWRLRGLHQVWHFPVCRVRRQQDGGQVRRRRCGVLGQAD
ncbi:MAG: DUF4145 domain-containing protein [Rhodovibrio sp.]|nr:DUF4145 domain-containing protein [Rhodovibrio sp.]